MHFSGVDMAEAARPVEELESQFRCRIPFWKRAIDVMGSLFALILLTPLFLLVVLLEVPHDALERRHYHT
jgi:lipopolysaccharide/colanic/teichoic acid biosynthesis glycosyltransferase